MYNIPLRFYNNVPCGCTIFHHSILFVYCIYIYIYTHFLYFVGITYHPLFVSPTIVVSPHFLWCNQPSVPVADPGWPWRLVGLRFSARPQKLIFLKTHNEWRDLPNYLYRIRKYWANNKNILCAKSLQNKQLIIFYE